MPRQPHMTAPKVDLKASSLAMWAATGSYVGLSPWVPGTLGTLVGLGWVWSVSRLPGLTLQLAATLGLILISVPICTQAARRIGGKDPSAIVLDEIASLPIVLLGLDLSHASVWLAAFVLHRVFDVTKPPPIRAVERLPDGLGIVADDCVAAVYAALVLRACVWAGLLG
ncbi:MAG: phosphatidylglycerophosphatase A [Pirellulales bacterium]|nr:phosphatidylglycerophosphatase A [Pirellulales bacterium]